MKKFLVAAIALSGLLAVAGSASAADVIADDPAYDWSGLYVGVVGSYGWGEFDSSSEAAFHELNDFSGPLDNADGWLAGGTVGFNHQVNDIVWGIEADVSWSSVNDDFVTADPEWHADLEWFATVRPRIGFAVDRFLPYVTGGLAIGGINLDATDNFAATSDSDNKTHFGWTIGAGVEFAVSENMTIKAEYDYVDFGREEYDVTGTGFHAVEDMDLDIHMVRVGLNWSF